MLNEIKKTRFNILLILVATVISCSKDITTEDNELNQNLDTDDLEVNLEVELQVSDFVWKGLNEFYYWQNKVEDLSDEKLTDETAYAKYISDNSDPKKFFKSLKHSEDRFSWIEDDYRVLENTLQGIIASNGVEFGLLYACRNCNELIGFVKYILKDSDAEG